MRSIQAFKRGRDREVVHRRIDHQHIRRGELFHRARSVSGLFRISLGQRLTGQVRQGIGVQVAVFDLQLREFALPAGYDGGGEAAASRWEPILDRCLNRIKMVKYH